MAWLVALQRIEQAAFAEPAVRLDVEDTNMRPRRVVDMHALLVR
jgi:hypothetical protein